MTASPNSLTSNSSNVLWLPFTFLTRGTKTVKGFILDFFTIVSTISSSVKTRMPVPQLGQHCSPKLLYNSRKNGCNPDAVANVESGFRFKTFWSTATAGPNPVTLLTAAGANFTDEPSENMSKNRLRAS